MDGLNWFPLLALVITLGLFPAYGFRPECVPLLLYFVVLVLLNLPSLHNDDFHDRGLGFILPTALLLVLAAAVALFFAPMDPTEKVTAPNIVMVRDERQNRNYTLHIFGPADDAAGSAVAEPQQTPGRPLLLVIPPEAGGIGAVDTLCANLADRGFTVISYSRDSSTPAELYRMWQSFRNGTVSKKANDFGRDLESGRREDLNFLLPYIKWNSAALVPGADPEQSAEAAGRGTPPEMLIIAGFGAGGAAAVYLASSPAFMAQNRQLQGIVAVESSFWSSYLAEERISRPIPATTNWFKKTGSAVQNWFANLRPLKMTGLGTVQRPTIPTLYLVSDHALDPKTGQTRYAAAFDLLQKPGPAPAALIALKGAGPLDYTDYPVEYSLYSALFPGQGEKTGLSSQDFREDTAAVITGFAAAVLQAPLAGTLRKGATRADYHLLTRSWEDSPWNLRDLRGILNP
ncbi:hypothetical protein FACS1894110_04450 [Spirochaetia bacterium]|nr:hypothetical protein FACS1894110_04450 [Spirochaetia bacterium]